jgi:hypothetical protein
VWKYHVGKKGNYMFVYYPKKIKSVHVDKSQQECIAFAFSLNTDDVILTSLSTDGLEKELIFIKLNESLVVSICYFTSEYMSILEEQKTAICHVQFFDDKENISPQKSGFVTIMLYYGDNIMHILSHNKYFDEKHLKLLETSGYILRKE